MSPIRANIAVSFIDDSCVSKLAVQQLDIINEIFERALNHK